MGESGSGTRSNRDCTDDLRRLDVRKLTCAGALLGGWYSWQWTRYDEVSGEIDLLPEIDQVVHRNASPSCCA